MILTKSNELLIIKDLYWGTGFFFISNDILTFLACLEPKIKKKKDTPNNFRKFVRRTASDNSKPLMDLMRCGISLCSSEDTQTFELVAITNRMQLSIGIYYSTVH